LEPATERGLQQPLDMVREKFIIVIERRDPFTSRALRCFVHRRSPSDHPTTPRLLRVHTLEGKIEESEARVSKLSEPLEGVVGASIPNDDRFDVLVRLGQSGGQSPLEEELAAIVGRDPDRDQWR